MGELPGFTPERIAQWLETYPVEELGLPDHTGAPVPADPSGNIISTPIPQELGPNIVEARPRETFTTPDGNVIAPHGANESGLEYIEGRKGHTAGQIDDIINNPIPALSGYLAGRGRQRGKKVTLLTGQDGHWVKIDEDGRVFAVSNRHLPLNHNENDPGEITTPLEE